MGNRDAVIVVQCDELNKVNYFELKPINTLKHDFSIELIPCAKNQCNLIIVNIWLNLI